MKWRKLFTILSLLFAPLFIGLNVSDANAWQTSDPYFNSSQNLYIYRSYMEQADGAPYIVNNEYLGYVGPASSYTILSGTDSSIQTKTLFGFTNLGYILSGDDNSQTYHSAQAIFYFNLSNSSYISFGNVGISADYVLYSVDSSSVQTQHVNCTLSYNQDLNPPNTVYVTIECPQVTFKGIGWSYGSVDLHVGDAANTTYDYNSDYFVQYRNGGPFRISANVGQYIVSSSDNATELALEQITEQNQTIINQNETIINQNETMINQMEATNDWLTDDTPPSADTSSLGNAAGWLPPGPLDSILNLPVQFVQGIVSVFTDTNTCTPIVLPLNMINYNLEIPCMSPFFELASVNIVWNTVGTIISAVLIFHTLKWLYKFVDDTLSFREGNTTMWGGL